MLRFLLPRSRPLGLVAIAVAVMIAAAGPATGADVTTHADEPIHVRATPSASPASLSPASEREGGDEGDLAMDEQIAAAVEQEVTRRLAGIPRPM